MYREQCKILENEKIAPGHYVLKLASPRISRSAKPGQFVQILCGDSYDPLLPRPFSFLTSSKKDFSILYQVAGKGTKILSRLEKGGSLWILGPLGNGFSAEAARRVTTAVLIGGGVGIPPLYHLAHALLTGPRPASGRLKNIHVFLGARHRSLLLCQNDFKKLGVDLSIATDDGSKGKKGFVTEILEQFINRSSNRGSVRMYTCGPTPMLKAVSFISQKYDLPCEVSVEVPMACGFGACLGCAIKVRTESLADRNHRFAIACCEGPVFQASDILWE